MATLIAIKEGVSHPAFGVAITLAFIVMLDASSLRRQVGKHASAINKLAINQNTDHIILRERIGHTPVEILAGVLTGILIARIVSNQIL